MYRTDWRQSWWRNGTKAREEPIKFWCGPGQRGGIQEFFLFSISFHRAFFFFCLGSGVCSECHWNSDPHLPEAASQDKRLHTAEWLIRLLNKFMLQSASMCVSCTIGFRTMGFNRNPQTICSLYGGDKSFRRIEPSRGQTADKSNFPLQKCTHTQTHTHTHIQTTWLFNAENPLPVSTCISMFVSPCHVTRFSWYKIIK